MCCFSVNCFGAVRLDLIGITSLKLNEKNLGKHFQSLSATQNCIEAMMKLLKSFV